MDFFRKLVGITRGNDFYISLLLVNLPYFFLMIPCLSASHITSDLVLSCFGIFFVQNYVLALFFCKAGERLRSIALYLSMGMSIMDILSFLLLHQPFYISYLPSIFATNMQETKEFLAAHSHLTIDAILMPFFCVPFLFKRIRDRVFSAYARFYDKHFRLVAVFALFSCVCYSFGISSHFISTRMPQPNNLLRILSSIQQDTLNFYYWGDRSRRVIPTVASSDTSIPYIVVVLGESANKHHLGVYGYELPTTPWADREEATENLIVYRNVLAPAHFTSAAMKYIFTDLQKEEETPIETVPTIFDYLKQTDYHTVWISNQENVGIIGTYESILAGEADETIFTRTVSGNIDSDIIYDDAIFEPLEKLEPHGNNLIFLHLMGSHQEAKYRYPSDFSVFTKEDETTVETDEQKTTRAEYDNSILYTDDILRQITEHFQDKDALVIYFSDHGEDVFDEEKRFFSGHSPGGKDEELYIPFFLWGSQSFQETHRELWEALQAKKDEPFRTDSFPSFLLWGVLNLQAISPSE